MDPYGGTGAAEEDDLLPKVPITVSIDRRQLFALAAEKLGLSVLRETMLPIDDHTFVAVIKVGNIPVRCSIPKYFYGEFESTETAAIQSAYQSALKYLETERMVTIDDYNAEYIADIKKDVLYFKSWSMIHETSASSLQRKIEAKDTALRAFLASFQSMCRTSPCVSPILDDPEALPVPKKRARKTLLSSASTLDHSSALRELSESLSALHASLVSLVGAPLQDEQDMLSQTKTGAKE